MNFTRNYRNMAGPRMFPGHRMGAPRFPTYNSSRVRQDFEFAENPDLDNFWVGPVSSNDTTGKVFHHAKQKKNKNKPFAPKQLPKVVEKEPVPPKTPEMQKKTIETPKDATNNPQSREAVSQPQNSAMSQPQNSAMSRPQNSAMSQPQNSAVSRPQNSAVSQPQNSAVSQPQNSAMSQPQNSAMSQPQNSAMSRPQNSAVSQPQNSAMSQPQNSGAKRATKKPTRRKLNSLRKRAKKLKAAANNAQNHNATNQPQNSGMTKSAQHLIPAVGSQPRCPEDAARKLQQPMPKNVSVKPEATNSVQPNPPCVSQPGNADDKEQKMANFQNGDKKKREAVEETRDADLPSQPHKKLKTEEAGPPAEQVDYVNQYGLRGDTSAMYSCGLCQYHTLDEKLIQIHFLTYKHKMVLRHLRQNLPKNQANIINGHLISKMKMSLGQKNNNNVNLVREIFTKISPTHYLHRIEATQCEACGILIPDVPDLLQTHIQSQVHKQNLQVKFNKLKANSITVAKEILQDFERQKQSNMGQHSYKDKAASSAQGQHFSKGKAASSAQGQHFSKDKAASSAQGQHFSKDKVASSAQGQHSTMDKAASSAQGQHSTMDKAASSAQGQHSSKDKAASPAQGQHSSKDKAASPAQIPSKTIATSSSKVSSTLEILVPEEDDDADANGQEFPVNHNEGPVDEKKDSDNMVVEPDPVTDGKVKEDETEEEAAEAP